MYEPDEEEALKDQILEMLGGEVDGYAAEQLPDEEEKGGAGAPVKGVAIEIIVRPHTEEGSGGEGEEEEEHDEIAHALGMHECGCTY